MRLIAKVARSREEGRDHSVQRRDRRQRPEPACRSVTATGTFTGSIRSIDHSLVRFFAAFDADFALVQFRGAVLTTEIPTAAAARHEGHPDSVFGFASRTLAGAAGFGHRYVSRIVGLSARDGTSSTRFVLH